MTLFRIEASVGLHVVHVIDAANADAAQVKFHDMTPEEQAAGAVSAETLGVVWCHDAVWRVRKLLEKRAAAHADGSTCPGWTICKNHDAIHVCDECCAAVDLNDEDVAILPEAVAALAAMKSARYATIAERANECAARSMLAGAPMLTADASLATLREWLAWCDPNGEWMNDEQCAELTVDEAWSDIAVTLEDS